MTFSRAKEIRLSRGAFEVVTVQPTGNAVGSLRAWSINEGWLRLISVRVGGEAGHLLQRASGSGERSGLAILETLGKVTELKGAKFMAVGEASA
jgi:hypothetical protein